MTRTAPVQDEQAPMLLCEFPLRISLETLYELTQTVKARYEEISGELVLEMDGDRERLQLRYYPEYQEVP